MSNIYLLSAIDQDLQMPENDNLGIFNKVAGLKQERFYQEHQDQIRGFRSNVKYTLDDI